MHDAVEGFLGALTSAGLERPVRFVRDGTEYALPLGESIVHVFDHATYHRGQLNTMVKQGGGTPIRVSYWVYAVQRRPA